METAVVCLAALLASGLTLFSGFGLGTILTPVMAVFFPVEAAVALTAVVHFANNLFKLALFGRKADLGVVLRFGLPALAASFVGARLLVWLSEQQALDVHDLFGTVVTITPVKLFLGLLIMGFALLELLPALSRVGLPPRYLPLGGAISGFFGGLSGHQGAFRSVFLLRAGLSKEAFIATGVVAACLVDATRLGVYADFFTREMLGGKVWLLFWATLSVFAGAYAGKRLVPKMTIGLVRLVVGSMLLGLGGAMAVGLI
ncbi:sulfite exporter TauE/SafE family protein [Desulfolutivibrio sp.]|uniref:sulfite exporter TauE/SafE family protein n=1 Tax=Desulfolutivibrio sp. TaxID=2773296 RepID=UPI002F963A83